MCLFHKWQNLYFEHELMVEPWQVGKFYKRCLKCSKVVMLSFFHRETLCKQQARYVIANARRH